MASAERVSVTVPTPEHLQNGNTPLESKSVDIGPSAEHWLLFSSGILTRGLKNGHNTLEYRLIARELIGSMNPTRKTEIRRYGKLIQALDIAYRREEEVDEDHLDSTIAKELAKRIAEESREQSVKEPAKVAA